VTGFNALPARGGHTPDIAFNERTPKQRTEAEVLTALQSFVAISHADGAMLCCNWKPFHKYEMRIAHGWKSQTFNT
jgi:hypothetical protein